MKQPFSDSLAALKKGSSVPGLLTDTKEVPEWLDVELIRHGQSFYVRNIELCIFAFHLSLYVGFVIERFQSALIFTKATLTPEKSMKRYLKTLSYINKWFVESLLPGEEGHNAVVHVRQLHASVALRMDSHCPEDKIHLNQFDMAVVQSGFLAIILNHGHNFGIRATEIEMQGYVHVWRYIGYLLGIEDRFNLCTGGLASTRKLCSEIREEMILPKLKNRSDTFLELSDTYLEGFSTIPYLPKLFTRNIMLYHALTIGDLDPSDFDVSLSWSEWLRLCLAHKIPFTLYSYLPGSRKLVHAVYVSKCQKLSAVTNRESHN